MGGDAAGNRYYENRVDYPFGQHRWIEPGTYRVSLTDLDNVIVPWNVLSRDER
jgi:hypothetical protein